MRFLPDPDAPLFAPRIPKSEFNGPLADLRRMSPSVIWYLIKKPASRLRRNRICERAAVRFAKPDIARRPTGGDVCIIGALSAPNGLGRAARYELVRLKLLYPNADLIDVTGGCSTALRDYAIARCDDPPAVAIFLLQPNLVWKHLSHVPSEFLGRSYRISLAVWELPYSPPHWGHIDDFFHEYWTPTEFSAGAIRLGAERKVTVVPHPVVMPDGPAVSAVRLADRPFRGLAIMDLSTCPDRKNPWAHIEAWQKAFGDRDDAVLTMKLRFSRRTKTIRHELEAMIGGASNIRILDKDLSDEEVAGLQAENDVCLSLHRAEGFGLTICEMLELGKPAIATNWSGNTEFMHLYPNAVLVKFRLVAYRDYLQRYPDYLGDWAEADTDDAARWLRVIAAQHVRRAQEQEYSATVPFGLPRRVNRQVAASAR